MRSARRSTVNRALRYGGGLALAMLSAGVLGFSYVAEIRPNITRSLATPAFVMSEYVSPKKGRVAAFTPPQGFDPSLPFVKRIAGAPGDLVEVKGDEVFVDGVRIGKAMTATRGGDPLQIIPEGVISPNHYFMAGETASSLDSRYAFVGYIHRDRIQSVGWPLPMADSVFPTFSAARAQSQSSEGGKE